MKDNEKISIIIPVYNEDEQYFIQCIESAINQTYKNIEIIVIDDGSDNNTKEICSKYEIQDERVRIIHKENEGVSKARNVGISHATGKFILFLDSDDWLELNACQKLIDNIEENDMLIFNAYINFRQKRVENSFCPDSYNILSKDQIRDLQLQIIYKDIASYKPKENVVGTTWGKLYKREFIIKNNLLFHEDLKRAEDHVFLLEVFEKEGKYKYYNEYLYNYRKSMKSTVNRFSYCIEDEFAKTLSYIYEFVSNKSEVFIQAYYARIINYISASLRIDYFHIENKEGKKEKYLRIEKMLNKEPYNLGIKKVNTENLTIKQQMMLWCLKYKNILYYYYILDNYKLRKNQFK